MESGENRRGRREETANGYYESVRIPYGDIIRYDAFPDPGYRFCGWFHGDELVGTFQSFNSRDAKMHDAVPEFLPEYPVKLRVTGYDTTYALAIDFIHPELVEKVEVTANNLTEEKKRYAVFEPGDTDELIVHPGEIKVKLGITTVHGYTYTTIERIQTSRRKDAYFEVSNISGRSYKGKYAELLSGGIILHMTQKWYYRYRDIPIRRFYSQMDMIQLRPYLTPEDPVVKDLAMALKAASDGASERELADIVLRFVQGLRSRSDMITTGCEDYFKFPAETLWDRAGDCECKTILLLTLYYILGYETVFHICDIGNTKHIAAGVLVDGCSGTTSTFNGKEYTFCEPTLLKGRGKGLGSAAKNCIVYMTRKV